MVALLAPCVLSCLAFLAPQMQGEDKPAPAESVPAEKQEESPTAKAFAALLEELQAASPKTPEEWEAKRSEFVAMVRTKLQDFVKQYPGSDEAYEARFQLAQMAAELDGNLDESIKIFESCLKELGSKAGERLELKSKVLFFLSQLQMRANRNAEARKNLQTLKELLPDSPFAQAANSMLEQLDASEKLAIGNPAIPFETPDLDGKKVSPKSFEGKVLLIDFWATWCGPCKKELPTVKGAYEEFHGKGFEILAISLDESEEKLRSFVKEQSLPWTQCFDGKGWQNEVAALYGIKSIPATFLLDRAGKIRFKNLRGAELKKRVAELIAEEIPSKK